MGDLYASALGTTVLRHRSLPPLPREIDGEAVVVVHAGSILDGCEENFEANLLAAESSGAVE